MYKRFIIDSDDFLIDMLNPNAYPELQEICDLLNRQYEEIEELKKENEALKARWVWVK